MKRRFGSFRFLDYISTWVGVFVMLLVIICIILLDDFPLIMITVPLFISSIWLYSIVNPYLETYYIDKYNRSIKTKKLCQQNIINIPNEIVIIFSVVSFRDVLGTQSFLPKNKIAMSIISDAETQFVLDKLHNNTKKYTTSLIEERFASDFVYGFVYDKEVCNFLVNNFCCKIIIPESIFSVVHIDNSVCDIYCDQGY